VSTVPPVPSGSTEPSALSRDLLLFFIQFSVALNKSRAYPPGHPVLAASIDVVLQHLGNLLRTRNQITIGVSRHQLIVDGVASDETHPVLRDLAERLHRHQLAAMQLRPGIRSEEIADLLGALASETWRQGKPIGLEPLDAFLSRWPHVSLEPLPLDQLELGDDGVPSGDRQAERLWQGLAQAALLTATEAAGIEPGAPPSGADVAKAIRARRGDAAYDRQVVDWLLEVGDKLEDVGEDSPIRQAMTQMFGELDQQTLTNLMQLGASREKRRQLVYRGARTLPVKAVLDLLEAAATTSDKSLSHSFLRLLGKLANHVDPTRGPVVVGAESVLRDSVRQLVGDWDTSDPTSHAHREILELLSEPGGGNRGTLSGRAESGAHRVVQMALELGVHTPEVESAWHELTGLAPMSELLAIIDRGAAAGLDVSHAWRILAKPEYLRPRLVDESEDLAVVERVLASLGDGGIEPLMDALEASESASRRRWLITRLETFGARMVPRLLTRLPEKPWFVQRNLLNLLSSLGVPGEFDPEPYARHEDPRVRREAYKILFAQPVRRGAAILQAAGDSDPALARLALSAAGDQCPPELVPKLVDYLRGPYRDAGLRAAAIRLLGKRPGPVVRDWLLSQVTAQSGFAWFRRVRLKEKSPDLLAALGVLAQSFGQHPAVQPVLELAQASRDPEVRNAARGGGAA
jgi:hypothetical protein